MRYCLILMPVLCGGCGHAVVSEKLLDAAIQGQSGYAKSHMEISQQLGDLQQNMQTVTKQQGGQESSQIEELKAQTRLLEELVRLQHQAQGIPEQRDEQVKFAQAQLERLEQLFQQQAEQHMEIKARMGQQAQSGNGQAAFVMEFARLREELQARMQEIQAQVNQLEECVVGKAACLYNDAVRQNECR